MSAKGTSYRTTGPMAFVVEINVATNVFVFDGPNWSAYQRGARADFVDGGHFDRSPAVVRAPRAGTWWVLVEAPAGATVRYTITLRAA